MPKPSVNDSTVATSHASVTCRAPAKLNLSLVVHGRGTDGFHQLETVMATIGLCDTLTLTLSDQAGIHLICRSDHCPGGPENLIWRSASLLAQYSEMEPAVTIELEKNIPIGGGLGGGSSDAASCLMGLNQLWDLNLAQNELAKIAEKLGSDVPFFLFAPTAFCQGRGEIIEPLTARCRRTVLLVLPNISAATARVFKHYQYHREQSEQLARQARELIQSGDLNALAVCGINNLASACFVQYEPLRILKENIEALGLKPLCLTGSGSTLFATFEQPDEAQKWSKTIQQELHVETLVTQFDP